MSYTLKNIVVFIGLAILLSLQGCKKSAELETGYIPFFPNSVSVNISEKKIELKASFTQLKPSYADNSGFEWVTTDGSKIATFNLGKPNSSELGMTIDTALRVSTSYKIRAWLKVGNKIFYSSYAYFTGLGYPDPEIISLSKSYAYWGETIFIYGRYFNEDNSARISVKIDNIDCQVVTVSDNKIGVVMPDIAVSGKVKIVINVSGRPSLETEVENYWPEVFSVSPQTLTLNGEITIKGKFHNEYKNIIVPVQKDVSPGYFPEYTIVKYSDDEIIIKRGTYMYCDFVYQIYFRLRQYDYDTYKYVNTGYSVKRTGNWIRLKDAPFTSVNKGLTCKEKGYVIQIQANTSEYPFWSYDPQSDSWTKLASFPGNYRIDPVFVECGGIIYCGAGKKNQYYQLMTDFWRYDPDIDTWTKCADLNFKSTDGVSIFGANIQNTLYVFSEWNNQKATYNPQTNYWAISDCGVPRLMDYATNFMYIGEYYFYRDLYQNNIFKYNMITGSFEEIYIPNLDRSGGSAFVYKGRVFSKIGCYLSEIDIENRKVNELYEYADGVSSDSPSRPLFIINDKPYFFAQPSIISMLKIE